MKEIEQQVHQPLKEVLMRFFLQMLPVVAIVFYIIKSASIDVPFLSGKVIELTFTFGVAVFLSLLVYQTRIRFLPSFLMLLLLGWLITFVASKLGGNDLDPTLRSHRLRMYFFIFYAGWIIAFGLKRWRILPTLLAILIVGLSIALVVNLIFNLEKEDFYMYLLLLIPTLLLAAYIIFISEQLRDYQKFGSKGGFKMTLNSLVFLLLALGLFAWVFQLFKNDLNQTIAQITAGKYEEKSGLLEKDTDGSRLKDQTSLSNSNHRSNELLIAVFIDHFFEGTQIPNPLYLTSFYYALYDTATETFEVDYNLPDKDLFRPDMSRIPLYQTLTDSSVLNFGKGNKGLKTVDIEVYNKGLPPSEFVAPTTAFSAQPIAVDIDYQQEYKSAYIAKSSVSNLNSAYFVYNTKNPQAEAFQEERYRLLRTVNDFEAMDSAAYAYYTYFPETESLSEVRALATSITSGIENPIDKIIAIKDYFLSTDEHGISLFSYTDNPGIPDIPSTKTLNYFLFESRKGYCAHYAGATLFMLRSLGIPSRVAAGFLTEDRSTTNPGWYYVYANQAHAWVQVYFPGWGWLDFDTTVGNDEARESEQPDGTPPLQPDKATLTFSGYITAVDVAKNTIDIETNIGTLSGSNFHSEDYFPLTVDVSLAKIIRDTGSLSISDLKVNDTLTAISYDKSWLKNEGQIQNMKALVQSVEEPVAIDRVQLRPILNKKPKEIQTTTESQQEKQIWSRWMTVGLILFLLTILILSIPFIIRRYYLQQSKTNNLKKSAHYNYLFTMYCLWMMGVKKQSSETSEAFAQRIDKSMNIGFSSFMNLYLKLKYSSQEMNPQEENQIKSYSNHTVQSLRTHFHNRTRRKKWLNVRAALKFVFSNKNVD